MDHFNVSFIESLSSSFGPREAPFRGVEGSHFVDTVPT